MFTCPINHLSLGWKCVWINEQHSCPRVQSVCVSSDCVKEITYITWSICFVGITQFLDYAAHFLLKYAVTYDFLCTQSTDKQAFSFIVSKKWKELQKMFISGIVEEKKM